MYDRRVLSRYAALLVVVTAGCDEVLGLDLDLTLEPSTAPAVIAAQGAHAMDVAGLTYPVEIVDGEARVLLVSLHAGGACGDPAPAAIGVSYGGAPLVRIATLTGTPCGPGATVTEQWLLVAPPVGVADVALTLAPTPHVVHSTALSLTGVDPAAPVRNIATGSGTGLASTVTVLSAPGDLVVNAVCQGDGIAAPGGAESLLRIDNVDNSHTLNNSAVSIAPGAAPAVTSTWSFTAQDEWQTIATSLRPAPR